MVYSMKSLLYKREDLSSDAQHTYKRIGAVPSHVNLIRVQKDPPLGLIARKLGELQL